MSHEDKLTLDEIVELLAARYDHLFTDSEETKKVVRDILTLGYKMGAFTAVWT